jgi:hypothetical protein
MNENEYGYPDTGLMPSFMVHVTSSKTDIFWVRNSLGSWNPKAHYHIKEPNF